MSSFYLSLCLHKKVVLWHSWQSEDDHRNRILQNLTLILLVWGAQKTFSHPNKFFQPGSNKFFLQSRDVISQNLTINLGSNHPSSLQEKKKCSWSLCLHISPIVLFKKKGTIFYHLWFRKMISQRNLRYHGMEENFPQYV